MVIAGAARPSRATTPSIISAVVASGHGGAPSPAPDLEFCRLHIWSRQLGRSGSHVQAEPSPLSLAAGHGRPAIWKFAGQIWRQNSRVGPATRPC
ncbi:hypothetical protein NL676_033838 [Syzygium grande]|nr:hypothetical protein NL676_033838 [Syzygium grande]